MFKISIFFISNFLYLNMGFTQTSAPAVVPTLQSGPTPLIQPMPTTPSGGATAAPTTLPVAVPIINAAPPTTTAVLNSTSADSLLNLVGSVNAGKGKYEEYQSVCRENLFDNVAHMDKVTQEKRIEDIRAKIRGTMTPASLNIQLLKEYVDQGKKMDIEQQFAKLKEEHLDEENTRVADALYAFAKGEPNRAESTLAKLVVENPKNKQALGYLAEIYRLDHNYFEATSAYFDLAKLTKETFDLELCEIQTLDSQHNDAEKSCKKAIQKDGSSPYPEIYLGISEREKLKYSEAIIYFKNSLKKRPTEMAFVCLGEIFFIKENFKNAAELFRRGLKMAPESSRAMLGLAWSLIKDRKINEALETFKQACSRDRKVKTDIRRAFKILSDAKISLARQFADLAQNCD